jgi:hypothetical protein
MALGKRESQIAIITEAGELIENGTGVSLDVARGEFEYYEEEVARHREVMP